MKYTTTLLNHDDGTHRREGTMLMVNSIQKKKCVSKTFNKQTMRWGLRCRFLVFKLKTGYLPNNLLAETNHNDECKCRKQYLFHLVEHVRRIIMRKQK